ncbi:MAG: BrnA antitoxin family protein [Betaproteobacteria bacterium]|nr:BrnA antitoxin family protein [Betaproteobacteria bacterium]
MPKLKPGTLLPTDEEDAAITAAALSDPDALPLSDEQWKAMPVMRIGRPKARATKQPVKLRLDPDVLAALREAGDGWQTRINDMLRASLRLAGRL